jgi:hypothetical protein
MSTKKHDEAEAHEAPKAKAAEQAFPFSASINEPQTVSLPLPENIDVPVPAITGIDPDACAVGDADFDLHVSGENFFADSVIHFAGHDEPTTLNEDGTLSTGVKPSLWSEPVVVQVMIKNGPKVSEPVDFTFAAAGTQDAHRSGKRRR